jgi:hypothetical protein
MPYRRALRSPSQCRTGVGHLLFKLRCVHVDRARFRHGHDEGVRQGRGDFTVGGTILATAACRVGGGNGPETTVGLVILGASWNNVFVSCKCALCSWLGALRSTSSRAQACDIIVCYCGSLKGERSRGRRGLRVLQWSCSPQLSQNPVENMVSEQSGFLGRGRLSTLSSSVQLDEISVRSFAKLRVHCWQTLSISEEHVWVCNVCPCVCWVVWVRLYLYFFIFL